MILIGRVIESINVTLTELNPVIVLIIYLNNVKFSENNGFSFK